MENLQGWIAYTPCSQGYLASIGLGLFTFTSFLRPEFSAMTKTLCSNLFANHCHLTIRRTRIQKRLIRGILKANILLKRRGWSWLLLIPFAKIREPEKCHSPPVNPSGWPSSSFFASLTVFLSSSLSCPFSALKLGGEPGTHTSPFSPTCLYFN